MPIANQHTVNRRSCSIVSAASTLSLHADILSGSICSDNEYLCNNNNDDDDDDDDNNNNNNNNNNTVDRLCRY